MQKIAYQRFCPISISYSRFGFIICPSRLMLEEGADKHVKCWPLFLETVEAAKAVTKANFVEVATQHGALCCGKFFVVLLLTWGTLMFLFL